MAQFTAAKSAITLVASTAKTILQLVPASNTPLALVELSVSFDSTTASDNPCLVEVLRQTTAGTMTSLTPVTDREDNSKTAAFTAAHTATVEPTAGNILRNWQVTPVGGLLVIEWMPGREITAMANRLGLRITPGAAINGKVTAYMTVAEGV